MAQLETNLNNLHTVEDKQKSQDEALEKIELRFQQIGGGLQDHGKLLTTLSTTQAQQGKLLTSLNNKNDNLTNMTFSITGQPLPQDKTVTTPLTQPDEPNTSHGDPEGMES